MEAIAIIHGVTIIWLLWWQMEVENFHFYFPEDPDPDEPDEKSAHNLGRLCFLWSRASMPW